MAAAWSTTSRARCGSFAAAASPFEDYDLPDLKTLDGIVELGEGLKGAFFKNTEGNTIGVSTDFMEALRKAA